MAETLFVPPKSDVYNEDCMELMKRYPDKYFELAVVDPPYGLGADKEKYTPINKTWSGKKKVGYTSKDWDKEIPNDEYFSELMRVSKNQIVWGGNFFGLAGGYIFWDKKETMPTYTKGELAWCSFMNKIEYFDFLWSGYKKQIQETRIHPTQKPVALYDWILKNYAKPKDKILDTHMGSQSSRIAAYKAGFDYVGSELDPDYFRDGCKRFEDFRKQIRLF